MHNKFNMLQQKFMRIACNLLQSKRTLVYNNAFALFQAF